MVKSNIISSETIISNLTKKENNYEIIVDTANIDYFNISCLTINTSEPNISNVFDKLTFTFNNFISSIPSELFNMFNNNNGDNKMINLHPFFYNEFLYVKNQFLKIELFNVKNVNSIDLIFNNYVLKENNTEQSIKCYEINELVCNEYIILEKSNIDNVIWYYKDINNNFINPIVSSYVFTSNYPNQTCDLKNQFNESYYNDINHYKYYNRPINPYFNVEFFNGNNKYLIFNQQINQQLKNHNIKQFVCICKKY